MEDILLDKEEQLRRLKKHPRVFPLVIKRLEREIKKIKEERSNQFTNFKI